MAHPLASGRILGETHLRRASFGVLPSCSAVPAIVSLGPLPALPPHTTLATALHSSDDTVTPREQQMALMLQLYLHIPIGFGNCPAQLHLCNLRHHLLLFICINFGSITPSSGL